MLQIKKRSVLPVHSAQPIAVDRDVSPLPKTQTEQDILAEYWRGDLATQDPAPIGPILPDPKEDLLVDRASIIFDQRHAGKLPF